MSHNLFSFMQTFELRLWNQSVQALWAFHKRDERALQWTRHLPPEILADSDTARIVFRQFSQVAAQWESNPSLFRDMIQQANLRAGLVPLKLGREEHAKAQCETSGMESALATWWQELVQLLTLVCRETEL